MPDERRKREQPGQHHHVELGGAEAFEILLAERLDELLDIEACRAGSLGAHCAPTSVSGASGAAGVVAGGIGRAAAGGRCSLAMNAVAARQPFWNSTSRICGLRPKSVADTPIVSTYTVRFPTSSSANG